MRKTNSIPQNQPLQQYNVGGRDWFITDDFKEVQIWTSHWWCDDGDGVELCIYKDGSGFDLSCFSGIQASKISLSDADYGTIWHKAFGEFDFTFGHTAAAIGSIGDYVYVEQCIMLADWFCGLFCEWIDVSENKPLPQ